MGNDPQGQTSKNGCHTRWGTPLDFATGFRVGSSFALLDSGGLERACAYVAEMRRTAAYGTVLDTLERFALDRGRALLRDNLAATVQARAAGEKKLGRQTRLDCKGLVG